MCVYVMVVEGEPVLSLLSLSLSLSLRNTLMNMAHNAILKHMLDDSGNVYMYLYNVINLCACIYFSLSLCLFPFSLLSLLRLL